MTSMLDSRGRWRRIIWNCRAERGPLLTRYYLIDLPWFGIYLHHLQSSDDDRALHDHPWSFVTCLLSSGYYEIVPSPMRPYDLVEWTATRDPQLPMGYAKHWRHRFSILVRRAEYKHRLELPRPMWTLVLRWRARRTWGFWTPGGFLDFKAYGREHCD